MSQIIMQIAGWLISPILAFVIGRLTIKLDSLQAHNAKKDEMAKSESVAIKETCKYVLKNLLKMIMILCRTARLVLSGR